MNKAIYCIFFACCISCSQQAKKPISPAKVEHQVKENELTTITLTKDAVKRLGIQTTVVQNKMVSRTQEFSGEVISVPGSAVTITAPVAGTIVAPRNGSKVQAGANVSKGQELFRLLILPSERDLLSAREDVQQKTVQLDVSRKKLERATELHRDGAGSLRAKQEAEAEVAANKAALRVAQSRVELLSNKTPSALADRISTLNVTAPVSGVIQRLNVSTSQIVAAGTALADIASLEAVWVRIPVYAGDINTLNNAGTATIRQLSDFGNETNSILAKPVQGPQTADPASSSIYAYYQPLTSKDGFLPGQRVSVSVPLKDYYSSLVVPFSAIVYDIQGGTWVYENPDSTVYVRKRVEVENVENNIAVIKRGIEVNARIVTVGVAELFGTEFGGGK